MSILSMLRETFSGLKGSLPIDSYVVPLKVQGIVHVKKYVNGTSSG